MFGRPSRHEAEREPGWWGGHRVGREGAFLRRESGLARCPGWHSLGACPGLSSVGVLAPTGLMEKRWRLFRGKTKDDYGERGGK